MKFKCRHCRQKVLVDRKLARTAITCPMCDQVIPAPQPVRFWMEIGGGLVLFAAGMAFAHSPLAATHLPFGSVSTQSPTGGSAAMQTVVQPKWLVDSSEE